MPLRNYVVRKSKITRLGFVQIVLWTVIEIL